MIVAAPLARARRTESGLQAPRHIFSELRTFFRSLTAISHQVGHIALVVSGLLLIVDHPIWFLSCSGDLGSRLISRLNRFIFGGSVEADCISGGSWKGVTR
jgi:hypothetical protein